VQSSKRGGMPFILPPTFSLGWPIRRYPVRTQLSATSGLGCPSRFAGGQRAARCLPSVSGSRSGASSQQALAFHAGWIEYLAFEASVGYRELCLEHFIGLPGSNRLGSQSVVMKEQFQLKLASPPKVERFVVTPPPNHSFKRTSLRAAA
jgi:hypothetical protein